MTQYICKLPIPLKQEQVKVGGEWQHKDIDTLYFKEPSFRQIMHDIDTICGCIKFAETAYISAIPLDIMQSLEKKYDRKENQDKGEEKERGQIILENINLTRSIKKSFYDNFYDSMENLLLKTCFLDVECEQAIKKSTLDLMEIQCYKHILITYLNFFSKFFNA